MNKINRKWAVVSLMLGAMMASLDASIVNVSLPSMMKYFNCSVDDIEWVVSAYMIGFAILMPLTQWLKDRTGYFALYFGSLFIFTFGSLLCGLAPTLNVLIVARVIQAFGGGALTPVSMSVLSHLYPPSERGRIIGLWGFGVVIGPAMGPTLGGILTQYFGWQSIFLINLPIGIIGLGMTWKFLKNLNRRNEIKTNFDLLGFIFLTTFLITLLYGISLLERHGFGHIRVIALLLTAVVSFILFIVTENRTREPIIDLTLFNDVKFTACLMVTFSRSAALYGGIFLLPFLLQGILHYSEIQAGLIMLPGTAIVAIFMPFAGKWADKSGSRSLAIGGLILLSISFFLFSKATLVTGLSIILAGMVFRGVGLGLLVTPVTVAAINSVPTKKVPLASSLNSLVQQIGGAIGVATIAIMHEIIRKKFSSDEKAISYCFVIVSIMIVATLFPAYYMPKDNKAHVSEEAEAEAEVMAAEL